MKTFKKILLSLAVLISLSAFAMPSALAQCSDVSSTNGCANNGTPSTQQLSGTLKGNPIVKDLNDIVAFLSAGVGVVVVAMLITGGIQYSMAGGSSDAVSKAKDRISNALIALVLYLLIFGFLEWIIPGGVFNS